MPIETFDFINARGNRLSGKIETPEVTLRGWVWIGTEVGPRRKRKRLLETTTEVDKGVGSRSAPIGAHPERNCRRYICVSQA